MSDLLLGQADLANGASGVADGEDRDSMALAALTLGAAGSMTDGALEQGAAEDVARGGEPREEALALLYGLLLIHHQ